MADGTSGNSISPAPGDALVVIDVQCDFLPGGALAVPHGDEVIPPLNRYIAMFELRGLPIFATRDWHPANHCSFVEQGGPWPAHCVTNTAGAEFSPDLILPSHIHVISKATQADLEAYSDFEGGLDSQLKDLHIRRLFVGGLATEYCVLATVRDALERNYGVVLLTDAIRAINVQPDDGRCALQDMVQRGAILAAWKGKDLALTAI